MDTGNEVYQVLVHGAVWGDFNRWLAARGIHLSEPMQFADDDLPTYIMTLPNLPAEGAP